MNNSPKDGVPTARSICQQACQLWATATVDGRAWFARSVRAAWEREAALEQAYVAHHDQVQALVHRYLADKPKQKKPGPPGWAWRWEPDRSASLEGETEGAFGWYPVGPPDGPFWDRPAINDHQSQSTECLLAAVMIESVGQVGPLREIVPEVTAALPADNRILQSPKSWGLLIQIGFVREGELSPERMDRAVNTVRAALGRNAPAGSRALPISLLNELSSIGMTLANSRLLGDLAERRTRARDMGLQRALLYRAPGAHSTDGASSDPMVFTDPVEYTSAITESVFVGEAACERARALLHAGGAKPLSAGPDSGSNRRSAEIATLLDQTKMTLDGARKAIRNPTARLDVMAARFKALGSKCDQLHAELRTAVEASMVWNGEHVEMKPDRTGMGRRVSVDVESLVVIIDAKRVQVSTTRQAELVLDIVARKGAWASGKELSKMRGERIDRFFNKLPKKIKAIIESKRGAGYRLRPKWMT